VLKMYHQHHRGGGSPDYWEDAWSDGRFDEALRFCEIDPLRPIFEDHAKPGRFMLEGGCGRGHYVTYYQRRGVQVVGMDFARNALIDLRRRDSNLMLCAGDVSLLPFRGGSFDVYYSGGVVEHFEAGAGRSLDEAWRVLRPGGILLISVPYFSPMRRMVALFRVANCKSTPEPFVETLAERKSGQFYQYAYTPREFNRILSIAGFRVISKRGYSIIWGLHDLPWISRLMSRLENRRKSQRTKSTDVIAENAQAVRTKDKSAGKSLFKRLVISEDDSVPVAGLIIHALSWACANMMMYVCVREDHREPGNPQA
jgi:SAM-dependent methyltransferase